MVGQGVLPSGQAAPLHKFDKYRGCTNPRRSDAMAATVTVVGWRSHSVAKLGVAVKDAADPGAELS